MLDSISAVMFNPAILVCTKNEVNKRATTDYPTIIGVIYAYVLPAY